MARFAEHDHDVRGARRSTCSVSSGCASKAEVPAGGLAQGERKLLDVAVAYALRPRLIFLDEPTSGVSTHEKAQIMDTVSSVVRGGMVTAVVIEHDMDVVFRYSDRIVMMHEGVVPCRRHARRDPRQQGRRQHPARRSAVGLSRKRQETGAARGRRHQYLPWPRPYPARRVDQRRYRRGRGPGRSQRRRTHHHHREHHRPAPRPLRPIRFRGEEITALPPHRRAKRGIGYAPENSGIFPELTVAENLMISRWLSAKTGRGASQHGDADSEQALQGISRGPPASRPPGAQPERRAEEDGGDRAGDGARARL